MTNRIELLFIKLKKFFLKPLFVKIFYFAKRFFAFAFGFLFCQNIFTPLKIGNTSFNVILFLIFLYLVIVLIVKRKVFFSLLRCVSIWFYVFIASILVSIIPSIFLINTFGSIMPLFKGIVYFFLSAFCPLVFGISINKDYNFKNFAYGYLTGYLSNIILSIFVHIFFQIFGYTITLTTLFPNSSFFEPNYFSSAQGLFLEPSHFAGFLMVSFYFLFWFFRRRSLRIALLILTWCSFVIYGMGNFPVFVLSQLFFAVILFKKQLAYFFKKIIFISRKRIAICFSIIGLSILVIILILAFPLNSLFRNVVYEMNPFGPANKERMDSLIVGLNVFSRNLFGVGFNMSGVAIKQYYGSYLSTSTTYNFFLKVLIEQSLPGVFFFLAFLYSVCSMVYNKTNFSFVLILSIVMGGVFALLDGPTEPYFFLIIGIACSISQYSFKLPFLKKGDNAKRGKQKQSEYDHISI